MKKPYQFIALLITLLISFNSYSQLKTNEKGAYYYEEVVEIEKSKEEIHNAVQEFLATTSGNSNNTIRINNPDQILTKGNINVVGPNDLEIVLNTEFKEGKYRILIDPITLNGDQALNPEKFPGASKKVILDPAVEKLTAFVESLKDYVGNKKDSDW